MRTAWLSIVAVVVTLSGRAAAEPSSPSTCGPTLQREDIAGCAEAASLDVRVRHWETMVLQGRERAASSFLKSNPVLSASGGRRTTDTLRATNWSATLSQELEIAGQRGARLRAAEHEVKAQTTRVDAARRDAIAAAYRSYFDVIAGVEEQRLMQRLASNATQIAVVARAMADKGLLAPIDADVADAGLVNAERARIEAEETVRRAELTLASQLGLPSIKAEGELRPLHVEQVRAIFDVPEAKAFAAEARAHQSLASAYSRARVPNVTVSVFVQNDGFDERVLGAGVSIPIPLPHPIGHFYDGEISEAKAAAVLAQTEEARARRRADLAFGTAVSVYDGAISKRALYTDERIDRAERDVQALATELQAGRVAVREALLTQQALVTLLRASVEARHDLCEASVELARAANVFDRGVR